MEIDYNLLKGECNWCYDIAKHYGVMKGKSGGEVLIGWCRCCVGAARARGAVQVTAEEAQVIMTMNT